eukprot:CAMPEP_0168554154 /NCGR_PEP_ID=MMETSP0413-20121227/7628_1 /TAXON_ID=136452 /ORGANISM="Filamoeba nolandi, Strain NC-AS-23-1" /LENGTH=804 /DNA_ID=CAMNT_0008584875 /DNA_START=114 /DNA_END=2528 /DNA_ORIENTATION=-
MAKNQGKDPTQGELEYVKSLFNGDDPLWCKWVTKRKYGKAQDRLIAVGKYRIFSSKKTITGKKQVQRQGHFFDLVQIQSSDVDKVVFKFKEFEIDIQEQNAGTELITTVRKAIQLISYHFADYALPTINFMPPERQVPELPAIDPGPADGLIATYLAFCDYYSQTPCPEVMSYTKDLVTNGSRDFALDKLPGIERKENPIDFLPLRAALRHNTYFTSFTFKNINRRDIADGIHDTMLHNVTISKLQLSAVHVGDSAVVNLGTALKKNQHHALTDLDLSGNKDIKERGFGELGEALHAMTHTLSRLNLAACGMSQKSTSFITQALTFGKEVSKGLIEFDMSFNNFGPVGSSQLANWLVQQESAQYLKYLLLADTKLDVTPVMKAIKNGGLCNLVELDISHNKIDLNSAVAVGAVVESNPKLSILNLSHCSLVSQPLEAIFGSIARAEGISKLTVNISGNELGPIGAGTVATSIRASRNIYYLIAKNCAFKKEGLTKIVEQLADNSVLRAIDLGGNFREGTSAKMVKLLEKLAQTLMKHPTLEHLGISGDGNKCAIGKSIQPIIDCLSHNPNLIELDISGNKLGDQLAISISDALRQNNRLKSLSWDNNNISIGGWLALANALGTNKTLVDCPQPQQDIERALKEAKNKEHLAARIREAMDKIKNAQKENSGGQVYTSEYAQLSVGRTYHLEDSEYNNDMPYGSDNAGNRGSMPTPSYNSAPPTPYYTYNDNTQYGSVYSDGYNSPASPSYLPYDQQQTQYGGYDQQQGYYDPPPPPAPAEYYDPPPPPPPGQEAYYEDNGYGNGY